MSEGESKKVTRVLIAIDGSENSQHAFEYYADHIHKPDNEVILFHVTDQVKIPFSAYATYGAQTPFYDDSIRRAVHELKQKNKELQEKYDVKCNELQMTHKFIVVGEDTDGPGHAIVDHAKKNEVDFIVVGSRGQGALKRAIMGSLAKGGKVEGLLSTIRSKRTLKKQEI